MAPEWTLPLDVHGLPADAVVVDVLARLQLMARRNGCRVQLQNAPIELCELVAFMGLEEVLLELRR